MIILIFMIFVVQLCAALLAPSAGQSSACNRMRPLKSIATDESKCHAEDNIFDTVNDRIQLDHIIEGSRGDGYFVSKTYVVPMEGFTSVSKLFEIGDQERLQLHKKNVTLPAALMLLDPETYPTQSRARKAIRQKAICICRNRSPEFKFDELGKVIARVYPGDIIGYQQRVGSDYYSVQGTPYRLPKFDVPVIYEDDHMAIVNKPAGVVSYRAQGSRGGGAQSGGHGRDTLLSALPAVLKPSSIPTNDDNYALKRPQPVHRLDRPTSGLVVVAKTRAASVHLSQQFEFRKAKKTYMAILNGSPLHSSRDGAENGWNLIDYDLEDKSATTEWRVVKTSKSLHSNNGVLTLVELKPKTGRYHQLRRHMAWCCNAPIVGDSKYDEDNMRLRKRGLFLCSNEIMIEHPHYNTSLGREEWSKLQLQKDDTLNLSEGCTLEEDEETGIVMLRARIDLPKKFESFLMHEDKRANKFLNERE